MSAKWREQLRAGNINPTDKQRLLDTGILDYSKETLGIEKGNINLSKRIGITPKNIFRTVIEDLVPAMVKGDTRAKLDITSLLNIVIKYNTSAAKINKETKCSYIIISPYYDSVIKGVKKENKRAARALSTRHELNETIIGQKILKKNTRSIFLFCGSHISPEVITRESYILPMFPTEIKETIEKYRFDEKIVFHNQGVEYGYSVSRKVEKIMVKNHLEFCSLIAKSVLI